MDDPRVGFIGAGTLGKGLGQAMAARGYRLVAVSSRSHSSAQEMAARVPGCRALAGPQEVADLSDLIFITTPDGAINQVASQVEWRRGQGVVHCSGAASLDILEPAARKGALTGSFHPHQTLACLETPEEAMKRLEGATFAIEGQGWLLGLLEQIASRLEAKAIFLRPEDRAIYHAAGVMVCGCLTALFKAATEMWQAIGVPQEEALSTVLSIVRSTVTNASRAGMEGSLIGPMVRGDTATIRRHMESMEGRVPHLIPLYGALLLESLSLTGGRVGEERLREMEGLIKGYMRKYIAHPDPPQAGQILRRTKRWSGG